MTEEQARAIQEVANEMYRNAADKGFHDADCGDPSVERVGVYCANLHGEVSELWEAARRGALHTACDKQCPLTCAEEELADIVIRVMDTAVALGINLGDAILVKALYNRSRPRMHGGKRA